VIVGVLVGDAGVLVIVIVGVIVGEPEAQAEVLQGNTPLLASVVPLESVLSHM